MLKLAITVNAYDQVETKLTKTESASWSYFATEIHNSVLYTFFNEPAETIFIDPIHLIEQNEEIVLDIDQAVNSIHQSFLEDDDESALLNYASDFKQYILYRDDVEEGYRSANE